MPVGISFGSWYTPSALLFQPAQTSGIRGRAPYVGPALWNLWCPRSQPRLNFVYLPNPAV